MSVDLFGDEIDEFQTAKRRYGVWPFTVWDCDMSDQTTQGLKRAIGDIGAVRPGAWNTRTAGGGPAEMRKIGKSRQRGSSCGKDSTRTGCFTKPADDASVYRGKVNASVFNPAVAAWLLNCYSPGAGLCFDPFAGGGTRAVMAAKHGLAYLGVELRQDEVDAVRARCERCGVSDSVHIECAGSQDCTEIASDASADFLLTCPPYWNLEQYDGGDHDLSMCECYGGFLVGIESVVRECYRILKPGAIACWVVGLHRTRDGELICMHHDITRIHRGAGFWVKEEVILAQRNNGAVQRVGNFDKGDRRLIRTHEYAMIYVKPPRRGGG